MKKKILLMMASLILTSLLIACSAQVTPTPRPTAAVVVPTVVATPAVTVVIPTGATTPEAEAAKSYTLDELNAMTDAQVRAFLEEKLQGNHTVEWVLQKSFTAAEWKAILGEPKHSSLEATEVELDFLIAWVIKNHVN